MSYWHNQNILLLLTLQTNYTTDRKYFALENKIKKGTTYNE